MSGPDFRRQNFEKIETKALEALLGNKLERLKISAGNTGAIMALDSEHPARIMFEVLRSRTDQEVAVLAGVGV